MDGLASQDLGLSVQDQLMDEEEKKRRKQQALPGGLDAMSAMGGDLLDTASRVLGLTQPKFRGGSYEAFGRTKALGR